MGAMKASLAYSGNPKGPDGQKAPNITPDSKRGIGTWSLEEIETVLKTGQLPYFDTVGSGMAEVVKGTSQLTDEDRPAIAVYLTALTPVPGSYAPGPGAPLHYDCSLHFSKGQRPSIS